MKLSLDWIQDFVDLTEKDPQAIERRVTTGVSEVDDLEIQGAFLDKCCVGKIVALRKHPGADRLSLCEVATDQGIKKIVCGGTNLREGMKVAVAHVGATVRWHGTETVTLEKAKIRGEESEGMICAAEELEIQDRFPAKPADGERPIVDFGDGDEGVGMSLKEYLGLGDIVLHIDNHAITHRADLFSHVGYAREFVALGLGTWKKNRKEPKITFAKKDVPYKFVNETEGLITRYTGCLLRIDGMGQTPDWMKRRLAATGWRSVNLPVDITNYVAMEQGMPLHSFDADDIKGDVHARGARKGETITTLDGIERELSEGAIVLEDDAGIFDLFGIMGGLRTSTTEKTRHVFIQAAIPDPVAIRKAVIGMGHRTDAATTYEKGVPRVTALRGLLRAVELFLELVPGAEVVSALQEWGDEGTAKPVTLPLAFVSSMLGTEVPETQIVAILESLEFTVEKGKNKGELTVTPPLHRLGDIRGPHDLVEEIGRVVGYNEIPSEAPVASAAPAPRSPRFHALRDALRVEGFTELVPVAFTGPATLHKCNLDIAEAIPVQSAIGEELSLLQTSTFPALLEHAERNIAHAGPQLKTFRTGHVFERPWREQPEISLLVADMHPEWEPHDLHHDPFLVLKRHLAQAFDALGLRLETATAGSPPDAAHPGRYADVLVTPKRNTQGGAEPQLRLGLIYEVHPDVRARFRLEHRAAVATLDLGALLALPIPATAPVGVPQFPAVSYDVTFTLSQREQAGDVLKRLRSGEPLLESVEVADVYTGKPLAADQYNLTLRFVYRAPDRTLTEAEAQKAHDALVQKANS
jgi:phenylalanyl-tRNA synthetase beta chain